MAKAATSRGGSQCNIARVRRLWQTRAAFAGADFDAADDTVGSGGGGNLDAISVAVLMLQHRRQVDRRHVTANADSVNSHRRRGRKHHEAQRE
jgi:hypothetical protein